MVQMLGRAEPDEAATKELIMKYIRAAPPPSTWDAPPPAKRGNGMHVARRETGMGRAHDYWKSEVDEYALPPMGTEAPRGGFSYFSSAKSMAQWQAPAASKPPVQRLESSNKSLPAPLPFTFATQQATRPDATLSSFTSAGSSSLAAMKALGLPDEPAGGAAAPGLGRSSVPLARGTKRLGVGRPAVPWGSKKAKQ